MGDRRLHAPPFPGPLAPGGILLTRPALLVAGLALGAMFLLLPAGPVVLPLDDAYLHLAVARQLVEHGSWGVNPGEFVSASSSPLWTALLALGVALLGPQPGLALGLGAASMVALVGVADAWRRDEGDGPLGLFALLLLLPLPFLGALGMEHALHAALALALVRAVEQDRVPLAALLAGAACLARYESLALVAALAPRRSRAALAAVGGGLLATAAFGAWARAQGGDWLPNSVSKKAASGSWAELAAAARECPSLPVLALLALLRWRSPRARLLLLLVFAQLAFGRVGWLYRYEAWLLAMGLLILAPLRGWRGGLALVGTLVFGARAYAAIENYRPAVRFVAEANLAVAELLRGLPGPVAVHDLGAVAFSGVRTVDVGGIGHEGIARLHREGRLDPESIAPHLAGVRVAVTGAEWLDRARPADFLAVARHHVRYAGHGEFETVFWARGEDGPLRAALEAWAAPGRLELVRVPELPLDQATVEGAAVKYEDGGWSFYTDGSLRLPMPRAGVAELRLRGSLAEGRGPRFVVEAGDRRVEGEVGTEEIGVSLAVHAGELLLLRYADDRVDASGADRNLFLRRISLDPNPAPAAPATPRSSTPAGSSP